jgi:hypothetical protein
MHCQQGEKFEFELACCTHLEGFQVVSSYFWAQAVSQVASAWPVRCTSLTGVGSFPDHIGLTDEVQRFDRCSSQVLGDLAHRSDRWGWPVWPVKVELLQLLCFMWCFACIRPGRVALVQGELAYVQGELFVVFELWIVGLRSLLEHSFVSDVSSYCPCLRGPRLVFFRWSFSLPFIGFRSLVGVSFYLFLFFFFSLGLLYVCVINALIKGEIEDHVWFEDWWMVGPCCDEWLTMLCGLILV